MCMVLIAAGVACTSGAMAWPGRTASTPVGDVTLATPAASGWERFVSESNGFEFEYPKSCEISEDNGSIDIGGRIELTLLESNGMGLDDYVKRFTETRVGNAGWTIESIQHGSLSGQEATTVEYRFGGQGRFGTATFAIKGDRAYVWSLTAGAFTCDEPDLYGPIMATFRFTR